MYENNKTVMLHGDTCV